MIDMATNDLILPDDDDERINLAMAMPQHVDLGDGRMLEIQAWRPHVRVGHALQVDLTGLVRMKREREVD